jgi:hypothetical protein
MASARIDDAPARWARVVAVLAGAGLAASGVWALAAPESFFDVLARFDPYNQHFIQDIGAFLIGLGAVLLLAGLITGADALAVGLVGVSIGSVAHVVSHAVGYDLGGRPAFDIPALSALAVVLLVAGVVRWRAVARRVR